MKAQDRQPEPLLPNLPMLASDTLMLYSCRTDTVTLPQFSLSEAFLEVQENVLLDDGGVLYPFWERLRLLRLSGDSLRVLHVGDSHIRGHVFPQTVGQRLQQYFTTLSYADMGINGAFCTTFTRPERIEAIAAQRPDLLILSFGTNESHNRRYDASLHYRQMDDLVRLIRDSLPDVPILMTTPPGSYDRYGRRRNRTYKINPRTATAAQTIRRYAESHGIAVWDMYSIVGGTRRACLNWQAARLMRPDHVHYLPEGYALQGELLHRAILKAYNDYVRTGNHL